MMQGLSMLIAALVGGFFIWRLFYAIKHQPESFSRENIGKSFYTMGILGIILAAAVYFVITLLNS